MANGSFNRQVFELSADERAKLVGSNRTCRMGRLCPKPTTHRLYWRYVSGKAGRTTWAERYSCQKHAEAFAKRSGVAITPPKEGGAQ